MPVHYLLRLISKSQNNALVAALQALSLNVKVNFGGSLSCFVTLFFSYSPSAPPILNAKDCNVICDDAHSYTIFTVGNSNLP